MSDKQTTARLVALMDGVELPSSRLPTPSRRPRKNELAAAARLLRDEAARQRKYAAGDLVRAEKMPSGEMEAYCRKSAGQHVKRAERWEKVAAWMESTK